MKLTEDQVFEFRETIYGYYFANSRQMPWRSDTRGYYVLVSEIMLQQTQVTRVLEKFKEFVLRFPDFETLAQASNLEVLRYWSGLGYNRRALFLKKAAEKIVEVHKGIVPKDFEALIGLPGIGPATANAILAYTYNEPVTFIETNIRNVFIHHFFEDEEEVLDKDLMPLITQALDKENSREWHWALMDYGTYLKKNYGNASRRSKHHVIQTKFEGSFRQARARILKALLEKKLSKKELYEKAEITDERFEEALKDLEKEKTIIFDKGLIFIRE